MKKKYKIKDLRGIRHHFQPRPLVLAVGVTDSRLGHLVACAVVRSQGVQLLGWSAGAAKGVGTDVGVSRVGVSARDLNSVGVSRVGDCT